MPRFLIIFFFQCYNLVKEDFRAMCILSMFISLNVFTLIGYYKTLIQHSSIIILPTLYNVFVVVVVGIFNYFYFLHNKKHEELKESLVFNKKESKRVGFFYPVITLMALISLIWLGRMNINHIL